MILNQSVSAQAPTAPADYFAMVFRPVRYYEWLSWPEVVQMYKGQGHAELMVEKARVITCWTSVEDKQKQMRHPAFFSVRILSKQLWFS